MSINSLATWWWFRYATHTLCLSIDTRLSCLSLSLFVPVDLDRRRRRRPPSEKLACAGFKNHVKDEQKPNKQNKTHASWLTFLKTRTIETMRIIVEFNQRTMLAGARFSFVDHALWCCLRDVVRVSLCLSASIINNTLWYYMPPGTLQCDCVFGDGAARMIWDICLGIQRHYTQHQRPPQWATTLNRPNAKQLS